MPRPEGSPYTEDVTIASCSTLILAGVRPKMECYRPFSSLFHRWQHVAQAFQSDPNLLPWCGARARVPPGVGESHFTPHVSHEVLGGGPAGPVALCSLPGSSVHAHARVQLWGNVTSTAALEAQTQTGASGWLCFLGGGPLV